MDNQSDFEKIITLPKRVKFVLFILSISVFIFLLAWASDAETAIKVAAYILLPMLEICIIDVLVFEKTIVKENEIIIKSVLFEKTIKTADIYGYIVERVKQEDRIIFYGNDEGVCLFSWPYEYVEKYALHDFLKQHVSLKLNDERTIKNLIESNADYGATPVARRKTLRVIKAVNLAILIALFVLTLLCIYPLYPALYSAITICVGGAAILLPAMCAKFFGVSLLDKRGGAVKVDCTIMLLFSIAILCLLLFSVASEYRYFSPLLPGEYTPIWTLLAAISFALSQLVSIKNKQGRSKNYFFTLVIFAYAALTAVVLNGVFDHAPFTTEKFIVQDVQITSGKSASFALQTKSMDPHSKGELVIHVPLRQDLSFFKGDIVCRERHQGWLSMAWEYQGECRERDQSNAR
ncbi:hypothetical protein [Chromobacterium haemolyticum]|uniref:hypothetical protein n=1 Tax=Chromobacterium haemolyticum TaxID=394935 RepID=UPI0013183193|nr:hypothetical protein [Chromobacterium haemolyticum]BBH12395.1 hypothetical protein CH06BL_16430 [Chromobacterium haemolyticum]